MNYITKTTSFVKNGIRKVIIRFFKQKKMTLCKKFKIKSMKMEMHAVEIWQKQKEKQMLTGK